MSEQSSKSAPPDLSRYSDVSDQDDEILNDKQLELELTKLRIREMELRMKFEQMTQDHHQHRTSDVKPAISLPIQYHKSDNSLPKMEIQRFAGDPKMYCAFMKEFEAAIENKTTSDSVRLTYLIQYCEGAAKTAIQHCTVFDGTEGYNTAKDILRKRFGRTFMIARAYIDDLQNGQRLNEDDSSGLVKLAQQMSVCSATLRHLNYESDLNSSKTLEAIVRRLPRTLQFKWAEVAASHNRRDSEPLFGDLVEFLEERAEVASTRYAQLATTSTPRIAEYPRRQQRQNPSYASNAVTSVSLPYAPNKTPHCSICSDDHYPDQCNIFADKSIEERHTTVRDRKLCRVCLRANHYSKDCRVQRYCTIEGCGGRHHRLLHRDNYEGNTSTVSAALNSIAGKIQNRKVALAVVPVTVCAGLKSISTWAFLDNGSDCTLIKDSLVNELGVDAKTVQLNLRTLNKNSLLTTKSIPLVVCSSDQSARINIDQAWSVKSLPNISCCSPTEKQLTQWEHLKDIEFPDNSDAVIGILIGCNIPEAHWVLEQRQGKATEPFAIRTKLGWILLGPVNVNSQKPFSVNYMCMNEINRKFEQLYQQDFPDCGSVNQKEMSIEDKKALESMKSSVQLKNGHYELALPWRSTVVPLPNNRMLAENRAQNLKSRLLRSANLRSKYVSAMNEYIDQGYAERVSPISSNNSIWYLPHHPVFHPKKPDKLRIVFDCAAKFHGYSLNDRLLSGPDLNNSLVGVLMRFRLNRIAVMADIKSMFNQVRVPTSDRDVLRFLWWNNPTLSGAPEEYRMCVHLFGATSSPSCASFALQKTISDNSHLFDSTIISLAERCFYVDDCLFSVPNVEAGVLCIQQLNDLMKMGGFQLAKWTTNSRDLRERLPHYIHATDIQPLTLGENTINRALGVQWDLESDSYRFTAEPMTQSFTRRNILSYVASFYDPLGYISPVTLVARKLLQQLCKLKLTWDEPIPEEESNVWAKWLRELSPLKQFHLPRSMIPSHFNQAHLSQLHVFCDASETGYGAVAYAVLVDAQSRKYSTIVMAKSRVAPLRPVTIPRMELAAATLAVKLSHQVANELAFPMKAIIIWSDSQIVLCSIKNPSKRFPTFFANRLALIHELSETKQWRHIGSKENPADCLSRGLFGSQLKQLQRWITGPSFLLKCEEEWPSLCVQEQEVAKALNIHSTTTAQVVPSISLIQRFSHVSSWNRLVRIFAWLSRFVEFLQNSLELRSVELRASELQSASSKILKLVQEYAFPSEIEKLSCKVQVRNDSKLKNLHPFLSNRILRVGGRLQNSILSFETKHPIILPAKHFVTRLIIAHYHEINGHMGLEYIHSIIRQKYWIITSKRVIASVIRDCVHCRKFFSQPFEQKMAPLPADRLLIGDYPFSVTGIDYFGPLFVRRGRGIEKRYGCLFTCFSTRAVHIEVAATLDTDSFLCAFNRFVARRGCPKVLYSDNATNFKGAEDDIRLMLESWNMDRIRTSISDMQCDWIFNPPKASHRGGVWERIIRSVKRILTAMLEEQIVSDELLHTTLLEVERILNDRPLVKQTNDPDDHYTLTPNKLLLLRGNQSTNITDSIKCTRFNRRWRTAQHLANVFWKQWIRKYLPTLQSIQRWHTECTQVRNGDLVLLVDTNVPRGQWRKGIVKELEKGSDGLVRTVRVRTTNGLLRRDIRQLCLLEGASMETNISTV